MTVPLLTPERRWYCPNCKVTSLTHEARPHAQFHTCLGLRGLTAPLIQLGVRAEVTLVEREDYIGEDKVQLDPELGRPVMAVVTQRDDGQDTAVFAPTATATARS